jgi:hypothetical protein
MIKGDQADTRDLRRTGHDAFSLLPGTFSEAWEW